jgi:hypothetical protein
VANGEWNVQLGNQARDRITGFVGVATSRTEYLYGCRRIGLMSTELKDGKPQETQFFDDPQLADVEEKIPTPPSLEWAVELGDKAKDTITGFEGVVSVRTEYLFGPRRIGLTPVALDKDGKPQDAIGFDEGQVQRVTKKVVKPAEKPDHGPRDDTAMMRKDF